jgi:hypothetical protein
MYKEEACDDTVQQQHCYTPVCEQANDTVDEVLDGVSQARLPEHLPHLYDSLGNLLS